MTITNARFSPSQTWRNTDNHFIFAMDDPWYKSLLFIQDEINHSSWNFFREEKIRTVNLPLTTGSVTSPMGLGSDSLPVKIQLEGIDTYLSDSMQFHLEYALRILNEGVHYIMPSFRGELADERHLCQFYHSEVEIKGGLNDIILLVNRYIDTLCRDLLNTIPDTLENTAGTLKHIESLINLNKNIPKITMDDAVRELKNNQDYVQFNNEGYRTITNLGEQKLIEILGGIGWLTHHDYMSVPFYQACTPDKRNALNADLLFGIGEVVGCGERHQTVDNLRNALEYHKVSENDYEWYIKMKEISPLQTAGFGMGIERFILWLTRNKDIRDCQLIPRFNGKTINP